MPFTRSPNRATAPTLAPATGRATLEHEEEALVQPSRCVVKLTMMVSPPRSLTQASQQVLRQAALSRSRLHSQDRGHARGITYCAVQAPSDCVLERYAPDRQILLRVGMCCTLLQIPGNEAGCQFVCDTWRNHQ